MQRGRRLDHGIHALQAFWEGVSTDARDRSNTWQGYRTRRA